MKATLKLIVVAGLLGTSVVGSASAMPLVAGGLGNAQDVAPKAEAARLVCNYRGRCYRRYGYGGYGYRGYGYGYRPYYGPRVGIGGLGFGFY